eukprot:TRINITY_DN56971_c0_g1_i1.p1 TRINITY_DN56971_c0_g1~~TRINITY_DN56971_c0_g1_i1.p1  ORF type:complete len:260 (+),score=19.36 TRINITY_DN56971_c0_g1_i1:38-817(+)
MRGLEGGFILIIGSVAILQVFFGVYAAYLHYWDTDTTLPGSEHDLDPHNIFDVFSQPMEVWERVFADHPLTARESLRFFDAVNNLDGDFPRSTTNPLWDMTATILRNHGKTSPDVLYAACSAMARLAVHDNNAIVMASLPDFLSELHSSLMGQTNHERAVTNGVFLLRNLAHPRENKRTLVEHGFLAYLWSVGLQSRDKSTVVVSCRAMLNLSADQQNKKDFKKDVPLQDALEVALQKYNLPDVLSTCGELLAFLEEDD